MSEVPMTVAEIAVVNRISQATNAIWELGRDTQDWKRAKDVLERRGIRSDFTIASGDFWYNLRAKMCMEFNWTDFHHLVYRDLVLRVRTRGVALEVALRDPYTGRRLLTLFDGAYGPWGSPSSKWLTRVSWDEEKISMTHLEDIANLLEQGLAEFQDVSRLRTEAAEENRATLLETLFKRYR